MISLSAITDVEAGLFLISNERSKQVADRKKCRLDLRQHCINRCPGNIRFNGKCGTDKGQDKSDSDQEISHRTAETQNILEPVNYRSPATDARANSSTGVGYTPMTMTAVTEMARASASAGDWTSPNSSLGSYIYISMMTRR